MHFLIKIQIVLYSLLFTYTSAANDSLDEGRALADTVQFSNFILSNINAFTNVQAIECADAASENDALKCDNRYAYLSKKLQETKSINTILKQIVNVQTVFLLGEAHNNKASLKLELQIIQQLKSMHPELDCVAIERSKTDLSKAFDAYSNRTLTFEELIREAGEDGSGIKGGKDLYEGINTLGLRIVAIDAKFRSNENYDFFIRNKTMVNNITEELKTGRCTKIVAIVGKLHIFGRNKKDKQISMTDIFEEKNIPQLALNIESMSALATSLLPRDCEWKARLPWGFSNLGFTTKEPSPVMEPKFEALPFIGLHIPMDASYWHDFDATFIAR